MQGVFLGRIRCVQVGHRPGASPSTGRVQATEVRWWERSRYSAGTNGCLGIVGDAATQRRFREDMLAEIRRNGGSYTLRVQ